MESDEQKILNLIADIRSLSGETEELEQEVTNARRTLEDAEDRLADNKSDIRAKRDELDSILDELIPENDDSHERAEDALMPRSHYGW